MRRGAGFGWIGVLIVLAIILLLASRSWKTHAPTIMRNVSKEKVSAARESLDEMERATDEHAKQLEEALQGE